MDQANRLQPPKPPTTKKYAGVPWRRQTTYNRPSLLFLMRQIIELEQLEQFYKKITTEAKDVSRKTRDQWGEAYQCQKELILRGRAKAFDQLKQEGVIVETESSG